MTNNVKLRLTGFYILILSSLLLPQYINAQTSYFIVEKPGTVKNHKYTTGDQISLSFEMNGNEITAEGRIYSIRDSAIYLNKITKIPLTSIRAVYQERRMMMLLSNLGWMGGAGYFALDGINGLLTKRAPVIPVRTLYVTGGLLATSLGASFLTVKTLKTDDKKWRVKTLIME